jgi:hypothetical protein
LQIAAHATDFVTAVIGFLRETPLLRRGEAGSGDVLRLPLFHDLETKKWMTL